MSEPCFEQALEEHCEPTESNTSACGRIEQRHTLQHSTCLFGRVLYAKINTPGNLLPLSFYLLPAGL